VGETGESLEQLVAERRWAEASKVRRFEGSEDAIEFRILKCGQDGSLMLLKIFYAAELMSMDRLVDASRIPSPDAEILNGIAGMNWERF
jgi:hypothetical protein